MFENCHLRIGEAPFTSCMPLSAQLLGSLYALPQSTEKPLREALDTLGDSVPWAESFAVAPEQTTGAVGAMLRHMMMATRDLDPRSVAIDALPGEGRARLHLEALRNLWISSDALVPSDLATLKARPHKAEHRPAPGQRHRKGQAREPLIWPPMSEMATVQGGRSIMDMFLRRASKTVATNWGRSLSQSTSETNGTSQTDSESKSTAEGETTNRRTQAVPLMSAQEIASYFDRSEGRLIAFLGGYGPFAVTRTPYYDKFIFKECLN